VPHASLALLSAAVALPAIGQSAQPFSVQAAALMTTVRPVRATVGGIGMEAQLRFNRVYSTENAGALTVGIGGQYSTHSGDGRETRLAGIFVEPRWALPFSAGCAFPYLSARATALRMMSDAGSGTSDASNGYAVGGGPGVTFRMTRSANLDVGAQFLHSRIGAVGTAPFGRSNGYAARVGVTLGLPR
jgi:hypothetical protein